MKLNLCCGYNKLLGWDNYDKDMDITEPFNIPSDTVSHIYIEHGIEHVTQQQALNCLSECLRVLEPGGKIRLAFPDILKIWKADSLDYNKIFYGGDVKNALYKTMTMWGHQSFWDFDLMRATLFAVGFTVDEFRYTRGQSAIPEYIDIESHIVPVSDPALAINLNILETSIVEAYK